MIQIKMVCNSFRNFKIFLRVAIRDIQLNLDKTIAVRNRIQKLPDGLPGNFFFGGKKIAKGQAQMLLDAGHGRQSLRRR